MTLKILAVDTATENCSVALRVGDDVIHRSAIAPREHTTKILPMVDEVLAEGGLSLSQLDGLAFGRGPGSFTGVRIGIGIAQGLAFGAELPMVGVSTLAAMAQACYREHQVESVLTAIDARMGELYWAQYRRDDQGWQAIAPEMVAAPEQVVVAEREGTWATAGTGWDAYPELSEQLDLATTPSGVLYPQAQDMVMLVDLNESVTPDKAEPVYLRDKVTWKKLPGRE
ncbi:tRNA (adenosine(37)-N6)-threonylcarbamoyltransferase complex dimerization subunit type 1 TsaB [Thaumasiovibrio subtropicus]|uniref:tRNA (adenosine(37)-N6)-threonylcarbamoyltransferase complex dimerization subunit type 1 TsaB n=1 Tax=Thaumasiovibrio subtropicus TaxID=1891207 RepID=UPI000B35842E|nr:tRNA (adenosine(37)-N6)-threonylcarbamoyltransferase complex dimerization subunit type 1 TsaB [Thaumasiovibrio subtropicus]